MSQGGAAFPHGFPAHFQPASVLNDVVHHRVREDRVSHTFMPVCGRDLERGHTGVPAVANFTIAQGLDRAVFSLLSKGAEEFARYIFVNVNKGYNISL